MKQVSKLKTQAPVDEADDELDKTDAERLSAALDVNLAELVATGKRETQGRFAGQNNQSSFMAGDAWLLPRRTA